MSQAALVAATTGVPAAMMLLAVSDVRPASANATLTRNHLEELPRDMLCLLAFFVPAAAPRFVRANRTLYARFADDAYFWGIAVQFFLRDRSSRSVMRQHALGITRRCPALAFLLPVPVTNGAECFDVSRDGRFVACGLNKALQIFERGAGGVVLHRPVAVIGLAEDLDDVAFALDRALLACLGASQCVLCPSSQRAADALAAAACSIAVMECASWAVLRRLHRANTEWRSLCFLPDHTLVAGAREGDLVLWDARAGVARSVHAGTEGTFALASSDVVFAGGRSSGAVELRALDGRRMRAMVGHRGTVSELRFTADGARLASASADGTARVWDVALGVCLRVHDFDSGWVRSAAVAPSGLLAAALHYANQIRLVGASNADKTDAVCAELATRVVFAPGAMYFNEGAYPFTLLRIAI